MTAKNESTLTPRAREMYALIKKYQQSGLAQQAFCEKSNISYTTFQYWLSHYRFNHESRANQKENLSVSGFIPLSTSAPPVPIRPAAVCEIIYPNGVILRLADKPEVSLLQELLKLTVND